jgi:hypothetical protein
LNNEDFNLIVDDCIEKMKSSLQKKTGEYVRNGERFHNFKVAGRRRNISPERALAGMKEKHCVSVEDIIDDIDNGILPTMAMLDEKFGDEINYLVLLKGLIIERIRLEEKRKEDSLRDIDSGMIAYSISKDNARRISDALKYEFHKKRQLKNKMTSLPPKKSTKRKVGKK